MSSEEPVTMQICQEQGNRLKASGRFEEAMHVYLECYERSLHLHDDRMIAIFLGCVGTCQRLLGNYPAAVDHFLRSIHHARIIGDNLTVGRILNELGLVHGNMGDFARALEFFNEALELHRTNGSGADEAETLSNIGSIYATQQEYDEALAYGHRAMEIAAVPDNDGEGMAVISINIGMIFMSCGDLDKAQQYFLRVAEMARKSGGRLYEAQSLMYRGECKRIAANYEMAEPLYHQALSMFQQMKDRRMEKEVYDALATMYEEKGDDGRALEYFRKAVRIGAELQNPAVQRRIGHLYAEREQFKFVLMKEFPALTPAEIRVCEFLRRNLSTKEISTELSITPHTVDRHRHNIRRKLRLGPDVSLSLFLANLTVSARPDKVYRHGQKGMGDDSQSRGHS